jgi:hypothetical protein
MLFLKMSFNLLIFVSLCEGPSGIYELMLSQLLFPLIEKVDTSLIWFLLSSPEPASVSFLPIGDGTELKERVLLG